MVCISSGTLTIVHGGNAIEIQNHGFSVGQLRSAYRDVLCVGCQARPYADGSLVGDDYIPAAGAYVEFLQDWGTKGNGRPNVLVVELGPQTLAALERLATATEKIATNLQLPSNDHVDLTGQARPASPYLTGEEAAQYLGISLKSLYGVVERRHLVPLRGPRRSYRFTVEMLDEYLKR
jgi:excisionase family DNA binding protein